MFVRTSPWLRSLYRRKQWHEVEPYFAIEDRIHRLEFRLAGLPRNEQVEKALGTLAALKQDFETAALADNPEDALSCHLAELREQVLRLEATR